MVNSFSYAPARKNKVLRLALFTEVSASALGHWETFKHVDFNCWSPVEYGGVFMQRGLLRGTPAPMKVFF